MKKGIVISISIFIFLLFTFTGTAFSSNSREENVCSRRKGELIFIGWCMCVFLYYCGKDETDKDKTDKGKINKTKKKYNYDDDEEFYPILEEERIQQEQEAKIKEMLDKNWLNWKAFGPDEKFVEFVSIAPSEYVIDFLPYMETSSVREFALDIYLAAQKNPDSFASFMIESQLKSYHGWSIF